MGRNERNRATKGPYIGFLIVMAVLVLLLLAVGIREGQKRRQETAGGVDVAADGTKAKAAAASSQSDAASQASSATPTPSATPEVSREQQMKDQIEKNKDAYPADVYRMAKVNDETLEFVLNYPEKQGQVTTDNIGEVQAGTIPLLLQWDERWGYGPYCGSVLGATGCGPTVIAMVAAGMTGDNKITPYYVADYAQNNGYASDEGTSWSLMSDGCTPFGIIGQEIANDEATVLAELAAGHPIICSVGPGDFANAGHFIVISGIEGNQLHVLDPNSKKHSSVLWDFARISPQIKSLWAYDRYGQ